MIDFPVLDSPRLYANNHLGRVIGDYFGVIEPQIEETDSFRRATSSPGLRPDGRLAPRNRPVLTQ
jgi:hypothetical protein